MKKEQKVKELPTYSKTEEKLNVITHLVGFILAVIGTIYMIGKAIYIKDYIKLIGCLIFGATLIELYLMSTLYHNEKVPAKRIQRQKIDHLSINLLIAGTCTAYLISGLQSWLAYVVMTLVWGLSILSIVLNSIDVKKYRKVSMACYIISGWAPIFAVYPLYKFLGWFGLSFLIVGGLFYTFGLIFYKMKKVQYMHSVWHFFVLAGSISHYFGIVLFVL